MPSPEPGSVFSDKKPREASSDRTTFLFDSSHKIFCLERVKAVISS